MTLLLRSVVGGVIGYAIAKVFLFPVVDRIYRKAPSP